MTITLIFSFFQSVGVLPEYQPHHEQTRREEATAKLA